MGRELEPTSVRIEKRYMSIRQQLGWISPFEGWSKAQDDFLLELVTEYEQARNNVIAKMIIRHDLDGLDAYIAADMPILNSLGVLQGRPAALEAAVGAFEAYRGLLVAFVKKHKAERFA